MQFTAGRKLRASELNYDTETGVDCHYRASAAQSLPTSANTLLGFATAVRTSTLVTRATSGAGHAFTVSRGGLWTVSAAVRIAAGGTVGNRFLGLSHVTSGILLHEVGLQVANTGVLSLGLSVPSVYLAAGDAVSIAFYTDGGSTQSTDFGTDRVHLRMAWLHD